MSRIFVHESLSGSPGRPEDLDGELLAAGRAMRNAIVDDLLGLEGVSVTCAVGAAPGCDGLPHWPATRVATASALPGEGAAAFVGRMAARNDLCWIVAPETGGELARLHAAVGQARWIGCDAAAIRCASSKRALLDALADAGVPTPRDAAASHRGRWLVKPDDGAGCLRTHVYPDRATACRHQGPGDVLEPFVEGEALSISMIVGADLASSVAFNRQRIEIDATGRLHDRGVQPAALDAATDPRAAPLAAIAAATARALPGLGGFVGIDVVWSQQRGAVVIEVNPRVTCAYVGLSARLGRNLAAEVLRRRVPRRVPAESSR